MSQILRAHTTATVFVGPFIMSTCCVPPLMSTVAALNGDQAELLRYAATTVSIDISGNTFASVQGVSGWYHLHLTAENTCEPGHMTAIIQDTCHLPVFARFQVVPEPIYDAFYSTCGAAYPVNMTTMVSVNVGAIASDSCAATDLAEWTSDCVVDGGINVKAITGDTSAVSGLTRFTSHTSEIIADNQGVNIGAVLTATCAAQSLLLITCNVIGTDNKVLISADAQNLEDTLDVNVGAIAGDTCNAAEFAAWINAAISGNDNKTLLSSDASWLTPDVSAVVVSACTTVKANLVEITGATSMASNLTNFTSHTSELIEDNYGFNVGAILGDTSSAQDLVDGSSNLDAAISSRSSHDSSDVWALASSYGGLTHNQLEFRTYSLLNEIMEVSDASGQAAIVRGGGDIATATYSDDATTTTRTQWTWSQDT